MMQVSDKAKAVYSNFRLEGTLSECSPYGNGHINDTYLLILDNAGKKEKVILQRMNHEIFPKPEELMENIANVTSFLKEKIIKNGGNPMRETLNVIPDKSGKSFYKDAEGNYWRCFVFVTDAVCYEKAESRKDLYETGLAFGKFQSLLSDFDASILHETIEKFHDTPNRFAQLCDAAEKDVLGRAATVQEEIAFIKKRKKDADYVSSLIKEGKLPLRVTHNDTKLNNIMFDNVSGKGICVIDLDTVMPGLAMNDFGDIIRFGASTGAEDETDLSKISCDMELYQACVKGFIEGCEGKLTDFEIELLPMGAKLMTYECGMRFLTDYLQGDVYFKTARKEHNLDRCRTQLKLVADMEGKWEQMKSIVNMEKNG